MTGQPYKRWDLLNYLIRKFEYKKYLEIGVQSGLCFENVRCEHKVGVDPNENHVKFKTTSDEFFKQNTEKFDIVFIDGLHESPQVLKDILNALEALNDGGIIVCHDMLPMTEIAQKVPREISIWNGNCWVAFVQLRATRSDLAMCTIDEDHGLGIITKGHQNTIDVYEEDINWENFCKNRTEWMNTMTHQEFYSICDCI